MKPGPKRTTTWGLTPCPPQRNCVVCTVLGGDDPSELRQLRDWYVEGQPEWLLAQVFGVPLADLHRHAWARNWYRRRSINLPDRKSMLFLTVLARYRDTRHLYTKDTPDKMLRLLAKLSRTDSEQGGVERAVTLTWEDRLRQMRQQPAEEDA